MPNQTALAQRVASPVRRRSMRRRGSGVVPGYLTWIAVVPALLLIVVVVGGAIAQAVSLSLSDWRGIGPVEHIGLENYQSVLGDSTFWNALRLTCVYAGASSLGIVGIATLLAAAVSANVWGAGVYRVIWFLPGIAPGVAVAIFWASAFQPRFGAVNEIMGRIGLSSDSALLADRQTAIIPVVIVTVWAGVGFAFLLLLGAMEQISPSLYEAARIDGASALRQFWSLTLPLARPVLITTLLLNFIWAFNGFTIVWAMTRGGPGHATATLPVLIYEQAFKFADFGPATALAVLSGILLVAVGFIGIRLSRSAQ